MGEDLGNPGGIFDGSDELQGAATLGTVFYVNIEHPIEPRGLSLMRASAEGWGVSPWAAECEFALAGARKARHSDIACLAPRGWNDRGTRLGVGCEHATKAEQMNQRGASLHKLRGFHYNIGTIGGAVVVGAFELRHNITATELTSACGAGRCSFNDHHSHH